MGWWKYYSLAKVETKLGEELQKIGREATNLNLKYMRKEEEKLGQSQKRSGAKLETNPNKSDN